MCGLVGAATIIGCLKYGACFSGQNEQDDPVFLIRLKDEELVEAPDDSAFLQSLRHSCARVNGVYPPMSLIEAYITEDDSAPWVRRLHLIVVDLHRRRRMAGRVWRVLSNLQIDQHAAETLHTLPIPWKQDQDAYQLRYVFGYAMDGSDLPCYILWPVRSPEQSFWCIDAWKGDWVRLDRCDHMAPLGIEHFFDAFCFEAKRPWRTAACQALRIPSCRVAEDTHLEQLNETHSRCPLGASQLRGKPPPSNEMLIWIWSRVRITSRMKTVGGQGCRMIPLLGGPGWLLYA